MRILFVFVFVLVLKLTSYSQYNYGLKPMTREGYEAIVKKDSSKILVDLVDFIPGIVLDIRYATTNNFTGEKIYQSARAFARKPVAAALRKAQAVFKSKGYAIKVYDAYRPYKATVKLYEVYHDTTYVASPYRGSRHNRGCAIDMTLVDLKTGKELRMPTPYDSFRKEAWPSAKISDPEILKNRTLLIDVMERFGFKVNSSEWWHFDFKGWKSYEVMDIDFEDLK
jgi:zinc D-Ala-D-Ala dipeptidase